MVRAGPMVVKGVNMDRPVPVVVQRVTRTELAQWLVRGDNDRVGPMVVQEGEQGQSCPSGCLGVTRTELAQ